MKTDNAPPLFSREECQELLGVLRSTAGTFRFEVITDFDTDIDDKGSESTAQAAAQTKIVARVLRRTSE